MAPPFDHISLRRLSAEEVQTEVQGGLEEDRAGFLTREYFDWHINGFKKKKRSREEEGEKKMVRKEESEKKKVRGDEGEKKKVRGDEGERKKAGEDEA